MSTREAGSREHTAFAASHTMYTFDAGSTPMSCAMPGYPSSSGCTPLFRCKFNDVRTPRSAHQAKYLWRNKDKQQQHVVNTRHKRRHCPAAVDTLCRVREVLVVLWSTTAELEERTHGNTARRKSPTHPREAGPTNLLPGLVEHTAFHVPESSFMPVHV